MLEHPAALSGPAIDWAGVDRVLVVRPDNLGDVVMAGPAIQSLRAAAPHARLTLLASPAGAAVAGLLPGVDDVVCAAVSWQRAGSSPRPGESDAELVERLRAGRFDVAVMLTSFSQSPWPAGVLCGWAGIEVRAGLSKEFGGAGLTHWVPSPSDDVHQVDRMLYLLERLGVPPVTRALALHLPQRARRDARETLAAHGLDHRDRYALVLPGASGSARRYPRMRELVGGLAAAGLRPVVAGTESERDLVRHVAGSGVALVGALDVAALAATIADSAVTVCNNSGGMHLADAVAAPSVVTFAGTEAPEQYRPRSSPSRLLTVPVPCAPCRQFTCPYGQECLGVDPAAVVAAALDLAAPDPGGAHLAGPDLPDRGPPPAPAVPRVSLLVSGTPRSGTTLVQRLCGELPGVAMPGETHLWQLLGPDLLEGDWPRGRDEVVGLLDRFARLPTSRGLDLDRERALTLLGEQCGGPLDLFGAVVAALCPPSDHVTLGEKTPEHLLWWTVLEADPDVRFVGVVRDPRAVAASHRTVPWGISDPSELAEEWAFDQRMLLRARGRLGPRRCLVLRYEDVVVAPQSTRQTLADFIGRSDAPARDGRPSRAIVQDWEWWKSRALQPVTTERVRDWERVLSPEETAIIVRVAAPEMVRLGYLPPDAAPPRAPRSRSATRDRLARRLQRVRALPPLTDAAR